MRLKWTALANGRYGVFDAESVPAGWPSSLAAILFDGGTVAACMAWIYRDQPTVAALFAGRSW